MTYDDIVAAIPNLSAQQLHELRGRCKALLGTRSDPNATTTGLTPGEVVYHALGGLYEERGLELLPWPVFIKTKFGARWVLNSVKLVEWVNKFCKPRDRVERNVALQNILERLIQLVCAGGAPNRPATIGGVLTRVPRLVDDWYPGYRESGLLNLLCVRSGDRSVD